MFSTKNLISILSLLAAVQAIPHHFSSSHASDFESSDVDTSNTTFESSDVNSLNTTLLTLGAPNTKLDLSFTTRQQIVDFREDNMDPVWWYDQIKIVNKVCDGRVITMPNGCKMAVSCHGVTPEVTVALRDAVKQLARDEIIAQRYIEKQKYCKQSNQFGGCVQYSTRDVKHTKFADHLEVYLDQLPGDKWAGELIYDITCKKTATDCFFCKAIDVLSSVSPVNKELELVFNGASIILGGVCSGC